MYTRGANATPRSRRDIRAPLAWYDRPAPNFCRTNVQLNAARGEEIASAFALRPPRMRMVVAFAAALYLLAHTLTQCGFFLAHDHGPNSINPVGYARSLRRTRTVPTPTSR